MKSRLKPSVFNTFDFQMCFAPQGRALFRHLNFQKCSETDLLCHVLPATAACNCSSFIWRAGSAPGALASLLLDPPEPQNNGKTQCLATFLPFRAPASSPFLIFFMSELLPSCGVFPSVHIVGSSASKLPSTNYTHLVVTLAALVLQTIITLLPEHRHQKQK